MLGSASAMPGCAVMAKLRPYSVMASVLDAQSASSLAAEARRVPLTIAKDSRSQPSPSFGNTRSMGAPLALLTLPRYSKLMPTTASPLLAMVQGLDPDAVYCDTFTCSASMNCQPPP